MGSIEDANQWLKHSVSDKASDLGGLPEAEGEDLKAKLSELCKLADINDAEINAHDLITRSLTKGKTLSLNTEDADSMRRAGAIAQIVRDIIERDWETYLNINSQTRRTEIDPILNKIDENITEAKQK